MIPKIIHYCWFGGNPLPELAQKCIESWKKYCPDYEIKRWDETSFDVSCCDYVQEAYEAKMWAFVSDYARFKILYENGGVYLDTDVELIKPIDDIITKGPFMGLEESSEVSVATGLGLASDAGLPLFDEILDNYNYSHFEKDENGQYETVVTRVTNIILKHGNILPKEICEVAGITIYPTEFFCPLNYNTGKTTITSNTRSIHHYTASWHNKTQNIIMSIKRRFVNHPYIAKLLAMPFRCIEILKNNGFHGLAKFISKKLSNK